MNRMISVAGIRRRKQGRASSFGRVMRCDVQRQEQVSRNRCLCLCQGESDGGLFALNLIDLLN